MDDGAEHKTYYYYIKYIVAFFKSLLCKQYLMWMYMINS